MVMNERDEQKVLFLRGDSKPFCPNHSRFAAYIERVRFLEADNKRLQGIITTLTVKFEELDAILRAIYDAELAAARKALDETTAAKAAVEMKVGMRRRRRRDRQTGRQTAKQKDRQ